jgi:hypothetical protein
VRNIVLVHISQDLSSSLYIKSHYHNSCLVFCSSYVIRFINYGKLLLVMNAMALQTVMYYVIRQIAEVTLTTYGNPGFRLPGYPGSYPAGTRVVKIPGFQST